MSQEENQWRGTAVEGDVNVTITSQQQSIGVDEAWVMDIARVVLGNEGVTTADISIALVDDATIRDVNRRFLGHDCPTDVISFLLSDDEGPAGQLDGEIIISAETAARAAGEFQWELRDELALYLVHGLLHLLGFDDHFEADRQRMRQREKTHLQNFGIHSNFKAD